MIKRILLITAGLLISTTAFGISFDPLSVGVGARPLGMGKAFAGMPASGNNLFINPSGISGVSNPTIISMNGKLLQDINYTTIGVVYPFAYGTLGMGYVSAGIDSIPITRVLGTSIEAYDSTNYGSSVYVASYAAPVPRFAFLDGLSFGASLKYYVQGFSNLTGVMDDATGTGFDMDLALSYRPDPVFCLGATLQNALPASLGGKFTWQKNHVEEGIPAVLKLGASVKVLGKNGLRQFRDQELTFALDSDLYVKQNRPGVWHMGLEWWPVEILALRLGLDQQSSTVQVDNNLTAGVGIKYAGFSFDYAYHQYGEVSENVTHYFSLGYELIPRPVTPPKKVAPPPAIPVPAAMFKDVPVGYWAKGPIESLAAAGIISGYPDGTFQPEKTLSRAELCTLLMKTKEPKSGKTEKPAFKDVSEKHWAASYIAQAAGEGMVGGYPDGTFRPNQSLTRAEAVKILVAFAGIKTAKVTERPFPDVAVTHWATPFISAAKNAGILDYLAGKDFVPNRELTRAEAAEMISKAKIR